MNGFKNINDVDSGVKRPFRLSDLQDIWNAMAALVAGADNPTTRIVSGFADEGDHWGSGLIMYNGVLYLYESDPEDATDWVVKNGAIWGVKVESDDRVFETGLTKPFYIDHKATSNIVGVPASNRVYIGLASEANIAAWKTNFIPAGGVTKEKIGDGAVTSDKIGAGAVTSEKIGDSAIHNENILGCSITKQKFSADAYPCVLTNTNNTLLVSSSSVDASIALMDKGDSTPYLVPRWDICPLTEHLTRAVSVSGSGSRLIIDTSINNADNAPAQLSIWVSASVNSLGDGYKIYVGAEDVGYTVFDIDSIGEALLNLIRVTKNGVTCYLLPNTRVTSL